MTEPLRLCVGDIGSNAIKTRIVEVSAGGRRTLSETRYPVRLGASVFESQVISDLLIESTVSAFQEVAALCRAFAVTRSRVVATSAAREALNRSAFLEAVRQGSGFEIDVISGREEARLLALGVRPDLMPGVHNLVIDVGGGSTEVIDTHPDLHVRSMHTLRLGAVRLARAVKGNGGGKLGRKGVSVIRQQIASVLEQSQLPVLARDTYAVGVAGTMGAMLSAKYGKQSPTDNRFSIRDVEQFIEETRDLEPEEIARKYRMEERRAQVIVPGALIVAGLMDLYALPEIVVSSRGLRDGVFEDLLAAERGVAQTDLPEAVARLGEKYSFDEPHAEQVTRLALSLFDQLPSIHRLPGECRELLRCAAMLHDIGQFVAYTNHHRHTWYLITNEDLPGLTLRQQQLVAAIALYHRKMAARSRQPETANLSDEEQSAVERCAALLRLADALDRQHRQLVDFLRVDVSKEGVRVIIEAHGPVLLELSSARRKADWFLKVYGTRVSFDGGEEVGESGSGEERQV